MSLVSAVIPKGITGQKPSHDCGDRKGVGSEQDVKMVGDQRPGIASCSGFFRDMKHNERRRSGRKILTQDFESLPPAAALAYNLRLPDYVKILCGSLNCLAKAFAELDIEKRRKKLAGGQFANDGSNDVVPLIATASLPTEDRKIIRSDEMSRRILSAAKSRTPRNSIKLPTLNQATAK